MSKQIILCMETNSQSRTDYVYIQCTLDYYFVNDSNIVKTPKFLGSKSRYNHPKIQKEIAADIRSFRGETHVIYFIDMDRITSSPEDAKTLKSISEYCNQKGYELVLFNKDIEDVYWGNPVDDGEKVLKATMFRRNNMISNVSCSSLCAERITRHKSNILTILNHYWIRKEM